MQLTFFDLKKGLKFTAPGAGQVEYVLESWDKATSNLRRLKDDKVTSLPTPNLLSLLNRSDINISSEQIPKPIGASMKKKLQEIKAGLMAVTAESGEAVTTTPKSTITEEAPLLPYKEYERMPPNFPIEDYSIKPAGDLRRMAPIVQQLDESTKKISGLDAQFTSFRNDVDKKIAKIKEESGYEESKQELAKTTERAGQEMQREVAEVQEAYGKSKSILLEYNERVWALYDEAKSIAVSDKEKLSMYEQALKKLLSPELVASVTNLVNTGVKQLEQAKAGVNKKFVSWQPAKDIRKKVKEELPKSAGIGDSVISFLSGLWESVKGLFSPIKENASDLLSLLQTQVEPLLAETATAAKETVDSVFVVKSAFTEN